MCFTVEQLYVFDFIRCSHVCALLLDNSSCYLRAEEEAELGGGEEGKGEKIPRSLAVSFLTKQNCCCQTKAKVSCSVLPQQRPSSGLKLDF